VRQDWSVEWYGLGGCTVSVELADPSSREGLPRRQLVFSMPPEETVGDLKQAIWKAKGGCRVVL
jgi:hypothetical protein